MPSKKINLSKNAGGPLHYLGNRYLSLPDLSGHMKVDLGWLQEIFSIISNANHTYRKSYEPFSGSASWSLAAMECGLAEEYVINDSDSALINTHQLMRDNPGKIQEEYKKTTTLYHSSSSKKAFFLQEIENYNKADNFYKALLLPFIINHSWGGMLFHDSEKHIIYHEHTINGNSIPGYLEIATLSVNAFCKEVDRVSSLLNTHTVTFLTGDFQNALGDIQSDDIVALNPPYPENERSLVDKSGMYVELYSPKKLHEKLTKLVTDMENNGVGYFMTYGFYNPAMKDFMLHEPANKTKSYLRKIGYPECAFGIALDQMYFSSRFSIPAALRQKYLSATEVLEGQELSSQEALGKFTSLSAQL